MKQVINGFVFIDDKGWSREYEGPHEFTRDGGHFEVAIPIGSDDYGGIQRKQAEALTETVGVIGVAISDCSVKSSGIIDAVDIIEDKLTIRVDDPEYLSPSELPEEVDI